MKKALRITLIALVAIALYLAHTFGSVFIGTKAKREEFARIASEVEAGLKETAVELSRKAPFMVDQSTRLDSVGVDGKSIYYSYSFPEYKATELDMRILREITLTALLQKACDSQKVLYTLQYGAEFVHTYSDSEGQVILTKRISKEDCKLPRENRDG